MAFGDVIKLQGTQRTGFGSVLGRKSPDLATPEGLEQFARQSGLESRMQQILATKGEKVKEIFSGGFISDIFDVVNALQYGVTGLLKGKGFSEGVRTRQSFSDKDALGDNGLPGVVGGIALDIAVDPLTYIAPWTVFKKIPGLVQGVKEVGKIAEGSKIGQWFGNKFVYRFGQDPVYREMSERSIRNTAVGVQNVIEIGKPLTKLDPKIQREIADLRKAGKLTEASPEILAKVKPAFEELDKLGKKAVDLKLLPDEIWAKNLGKYIPRLYKTKEIPTTVGKKVLGIFPTKPKRIEVSRFMKRQDIPEEIRKEMGEILEAGYPTLKGLVQLTKAVEDAKFFNAVSKRFGSDVLQEGYKQLPKTRRLGELSEKFVPQHIFDDIQEMTRPMEAGFTKKLVAGFKFGKVILNPATHVRNVLSNQVLNWWKLGMNPLDPRVISSNATALGEIARKGGKWMAEAKTVGYDLNTMAANEINNILLGPGGLGGKWRTFVEKMGSIYQGEENFAKLSAFIFNRQHKGLDIEDAWKAAESATFNYSQVTPFIRKLRESIFGFPFITFTYKATPIAIETALKHPIRISVFGKIKQAIETQSDLSITERERASEPGWVRDGFYIKVPIKDQHGRSSYFDLTYILPFGDLMSGNFFTRQVSRTTGLPETLPESLAEKSPFFNVVKELSRNQDFYGDKIWEDSSTQDKQLGNLFRYLTKTYLPPLIADQIPGGYMASGEQRQKGIAGALNKEQEIRQQRTLMQEMLRNVGIKIQPIDVDIQESLMDWEKRKALQSLLGDEGKIKEFTRPYVPK